MLPALTDHANDPTHHTNDHAQDMRQLSTLPPLHPPTGRANGAGLQPHKHTRTHGPMDTWSSLPALVEIVSEEAGCTSTLFSEVRAAAVTCATVGADHRE